MAVIPAHDCKDAGDRVMQEQLPGRESSMTQDSSYQQITIHICKHQKWTSK